VLSGREFNLSSPKQLQEILFDQLKLPIIERTATGQPSTAESVLHELAQTYELPSLILAHRSLSKLVSTYTDRLPERVNSKTGRVHTSYHQVGAWTGRFSSTDPNLQNIPIRTEEGRRIRQAFIAPPGYCILAADYSQIELRIMAHLSEDEGLLTAFSENRDIHQATAAEVFNVPLDAVTPLQRRNAKAINFGLIYGMSFYGLAKQLNIERSEAQQYIDRYFERYPGVKRYMEKTREMAHELGYVETWYGRQLHLTDINTSNMQRRRAAERMAINAPMQGTAADIIKRAMIQVSHLIDQLDWDIKMIMQVHDELVFEVKTEKVVDFIPELEKAMANAGELMVPLTVSIGRGDNWDEAH
jgi:DNA polymerase I